MGNPDRLSGLDASFLHLEKGGAHMHVGSCMLFEGAAPAYGDLVAHLESRLHLVPRYRQKLAEVPLGQGRPVWVDDPHFNPGYHIRHTALPEPAGMDELRALVGRVLSQRLDRTKPLWEMWLVDRVGDDRFAVVSKTHHCLVDGISGVDITTVLFDLEPEPPADHRPAAPPTFLARPVPSQAALLADALLDRAATPLEVARGLGGALTDPVAAVTRVGVVAQGLGSVALVGRDAPPSPYNQPIGPHRRFAWVEGDLAQFKAIKTALGGTVNDVVLAVVAGALREHLITRGRDVSELTLTAMVPMSVRADADRGALGNQVTTMYAPLPVWAATPQQRFTAVHEAMAGLKESGQAVGAEVLTRLTGFAPPTVMAQAARLQTRQRMFNLTVTNVPGPQFGLYLLGRRLERIFPQVPLAGNAALGIAIMSYDGTINFGLLADYDALPDLDALAGFLRDAIAELAELGGRGRGPAGPGVLSVARLVAVALGAVLVLGGIYAISSVLSSRENAEVAPTAGPGVAEPDRGAEHGPAAELDGGAIPTSGAHRPELVTRDARALSLDEILHALELGDVVITYPGAEPPAALAALQEEVAGPFDAELAAAGQAVILARAPGSEGIQALAWRHRLEAQDAADPELRSFAEYWLGRGREASR